MNGHPASITKEYHKPPQGSAYRNELRIKLAALLRTSDDMLAHAREGAWDYVAATEEKRRPLLEECFSQALESGDESLFSEAMATVKHQHDEVMTLVAEARQKVVEERRGLQAAKSATKQYRQNGHG